jgi:hypothetical protein
MDWKRELRAHPKNQAMQEVGISKHKEHFLSNGKVTEISDPTKTKQQQISQAWKKRRRNPTQRGGNKNPKPKP